MPRVCSSCACWFKSGSWLCGPDEDLLSGRPHLGVCKEGPVSLAKNPGDFCFRWRVRETEAGGRDVRRAAA